MSRLVPRSLLGQVMLALAAALLVAQGIAATLLYRAAEQRREIALVHAAAFQLFSGMGDGPRQVHPAPHRSGPHRHGGPAEIGALPRFPRSLRIEATGTSPILPGERREAQREAALREILGGQGIEIADLVIVERAFSRDPLISRALAESPEMRARISGLDPKVMVVGIRREGQAQWQVARVPRALPDPSLLPGLVLQTLLLFAVLFGLLYFVLRRITRPLAALADRTRRFAGNPENVAPLEASGPDDVRHLIEAHNAMQMRISAMLDEKDVMLGAIGHDLKTPLAALRVRIEGVTDETARARMAATIDDIARTLDEILALARVGRSDAPPERTDLAALAASIVEEFEDMGEAVTMAASERLVAPVRLTWAKRGLRNLVANAVRYAGSAQVSVVREDGMAVLRVEDEGPGIPADRIAGMLEPFTRGEGSRNRETGGAGLGLALTRAIAEQHNGRLALANRPQGGLVAELRLPLG